MRLTADQHQQLLDHANQTAPHECVGLISTAGTIFPLDNVAEHPETSFAASPDQQHGALEQIRARGHKLDAIYHSHTTGPVYPSAKDIRLAIYPVLYLIIGWENTQPVIRAFTIDRVNSSIKEEQL